MDNSLLRKKGRDLSQRMMDDLFTEQQKQTLEFTQGKIKLTIKDQLDNRFGNRLSWYDEETHIKKAAEIVFHNVWRIEEIAKLEEAIVVLKTPENHLLIKESKKTGEDTSKETGEEEVNSRGLNRSVDNADSTSESDSRSFQRTGMSEQTETFKKVEQWDNKTKFVLDTQLKADERYVAENNVTLESGLKGNVTTEAITRNEVVLQEQHEENTVPYTHLGFTGDHSGNLNVSKTFTESIGSTMGKDERTNKRNSERNNKEDTVSKEYRKADIQLSSLELQVPNLRRKFWYLFDCLYLPC